MGKPMSETFGNEQLPALNKDAEAKGKQAAKLYGQVVTSNIKSRKWWLGIGLIIADVQSIMAAEHRPKGFLTDWREKHLSEIGPVQSANAVWCATHPEAIGLVDEVVSEPSALRKRWRDVAKAAIIDFRHRNLNDETALAERLGVSVEEIADMLAKYDKAEQRKAEKAAEAEAEAAATAEVADAAARPAPEDPIPFGGVGQDMIDELESIESLLTNGKPEPAAERLKALLADLT